MKPSELMAACLLILTMIACGILLVIMKPILITIVIALMISFIISPLVELLRKMFVPRMVTLLALFLIPGAFLFQALETLSFHLGNLISQLPFFIEELNILLASYSAQYQWFGPVIEEAIVWTKEIPLASLSNSVVSFSLNTFSNLLLIAFFVVYFCLTFPLIPGKVARAFPDQKAKRVQNSLQNISKDIRTYLNVHTAISLATGFSVGIICYLMDIPYFYVWGAMSFLLNYIPTIGSIIATLPPVLVATVQLGPAAGLTAALLIAGVQTIWGNVVEPKIAGDTLGLSPLVILISLVFWSWMWGIVGAILAVPIASIVKIVFSDFEGLKPLAVFMDDK